MTSRDVLDAIVQRQKGEFGSPPSPNEAIQLVGRSSEEAASRIFLGLCILEASDKEKK